MAKKTEEKYRLKSFYRGIVALLIGLSLIFSGSILAFAGSASGQTISWPAGGKNYKAYNNVYTTTGTAMGRTYICATSSAPAGYLGAYSRLYKNDSLYATSGIYYNTSTYSSNSYYNVLTMDNPAGGTYNSYGTAYGYDTLLGVYVAAAPARSPNQTA
jgi:hypothetical protein